MGDLVAVDDGEGVGLRLGLKEGNIFGFEGNIVVGDNSKEGDRVCSKVGELVMVAVGEMEGLALVGEVEGCWEGCQVVGTLDV